VSKTDYVMSKPRVGQSFGIILGILRLPKKHPAWRRRSSTRLWYGT
jgi:hypothetical protein